MRSRSGDRKSSPRRKTDRFRRSLGDFQQPRQASQQSLILQSHRPSVAGHASSLALPPKARRLCAEGAADGFRANDAYSAYIDMWLAQRTVPRLSLSS